MAKTKPMKLRTERGHVDFEIERDAGNPFLVLMGSDQYALPNWRKLRRLTTQAIKLLQGRINLEPIHIREWFCDKFFANKFIRLQKQLGRTIYGEPYKEEGGWYVEYNLPFGKIHAGDLVEYIDSYSKGKDGFKLEIKKAIVRADESSKFVINNHIEINQCIISMGRVTKIIEKSYLTSEEIALLGAES